MGDQEFEDEQPEEVKARRQSRTEAQEVQRRKSIETAQESAAIAAAEKQKAEKSAFLQEKVNRDMNKRLSTGLLDQEQARRMAEAASLEAKEAQDQLDRKQQALAAL